MKLQRLQIKMTQSKMNENEDKSYIKEVIIVEGRDDIDAVQKAVNADVIATHGYGISKATIKKIEYAYKTRGIIILTDPDQAGNDIRRKLTDIFPDALQAYISKSEARDKNDNDIGVENASPEVIARAIEAAGRTLTRVQSAFDEKDMIDYGLSAGSGSKELRDAVGRRLGIGYANSKGFLKRLNTYGISRSELENVIKEIGKK
jgi:ribonuclease M5